MVLFFKKSVLGQSYVVFIIKKFSSIAKQPTGQSIYQEVLTMFKRKNSNELVNFPHELARVIEDGEKHGVSEEMMVKGMVSVGNLMGQFVKPDSPEEALMKEMWEIASDNEKATMAGLVLKMGKEKLT